MEVWLPTKITGVSDQLIGGRFAYFVATACCVTNLCLLNFVGGQEPATLLLLKPPCIKGKKQNEIPGLAMILW